MMCGRRTTRTQASSWPHSQGRRRAPRLQDTRPRTEHIVRSPAATSPVSTASRRSPTPIAGERPGGVCLPGFRGVRCLFRQALAHQGYFVPEEWQCAGFTGDRKARMSRISAARGRRLPDPRRRRGRCDRCRRGKALFSGTEYAARPAERGSGITNPDQTQTQTQTQTRPVDDGGQRGGSDSSRFARRQRAKLPAHTTIHCMGSSSSTGAIWRQVFKGMGERLMH